MRSGQANRRIWGMATWVAMLAGCAWGVELPWVWEGRMEFGGERTEWVVDLDGAPERVEVCLEGGGGRFLVDEASWDGSWNGTPLGKWDAGMGGWMETGLAPDGVTRHLRIRVEGGKWLLKGVRVEGNDGLTRVVFDREDGFEVAANEEGVCIRARVENGGGGWFGANAWESDGAGHGDGAIYWLDTGKPGWHWARARAGCDGSDEEVEGVVRWRVVPQGDNSPAGEPPSPPVKSRPKGADGGTIPALAPRVSAAEYYADCYGADGQLLTGAELKAALCGIINKGTRTNNYDSGLNSILRVTDACPTNSDLVQCIYLQRGISSSSFNKEHLWPQSHGIDGGYPAYSDLHHLRASESAMNSTRGNLDFDTCRGLADAKEKNGCWYTKSAWEPPDSAKGDVARAVMYTAVRYESGANPIGDLELVEAVGTGPGTNALGRLGTLLDWNELDPVDAFETNRNELIYARYQGNRNPFIDHPEWARRIFAPESWDGKAGSAVVVTNLEARQRYPWNGLVDIDYEVAVQGGPGAEEVWVEVAGMDGETGQLVDMWSLTGQGASGPVQAGRYRMTWDMGEDAPELASDDFSVRMFAGPRPTSYWVVDMGDGPAAEKWGIETWEGEPIGGWTDEYKTSRLVLRRIGMGTFTMGSRPEELGRQTDEEQHSVTLSKPYCVGVFEVTQKQWELAMGTRPSNHPGDTRPVEGVDYRAIRGADAGAGWPAGRAVDAGSFLGVLRAKTGVEFDLPTEAQWEHACRAGTGTALNSGKDLTGLDECQHLAELGRYSRNRDDGCGGYGEHTAVGSYLPNAWGLYDMHGNVSEWCLDWYGGYGEASVTNPAGAAAGEARVQRGGDWRGAAWSGRSACRSQASPSVSSSATGFRLACNAGNAKAQRMLFAEIGAHAVNESVDMSATATGGGEVEFSVVSGPGVVDGNKLSFSAPGTVVVRARQAGNEAWWPVVAEQAVTVYRAGQKLEFAEIGAQTVTNRVELSATATGGGPVEFAVVSGPAELDGNVLAFTETGIVEVSATQPGDGYWAPVTATQAFRVVDVGLLFAIAVDPGIANGSVVPDVAAAMEGEMVTLTIVPDPGWKLAGLTLNGIPYKGTSFPMPAEDVTVSAAFVERLKATYALVESEDDFEPGGEYVLVARTPGVFCSAMRNGILSSRIGVQEVEITEEDTVVTDSDSIVWKISHSEEEGIWTIYNEEAGLFAASPSSAENHAQLLANGSNILSQWSLDLSRLPEAIFRSVKHSDRWLSRNLELGNEYFAAYRSYGRLPMLFKKGGNVFKVSFDRTNNFTVWQGQASSITARARYGTPPYNYVWSGDLTGEGTFLEIPETLDTGEYTVTATATDANGREVSRTVSFAVRVPELKSLAIEGPSSIQAGETATYTCVARYSDGSSFAVSPEWCLATEVDFADISPAGVLSTEVVRMDRYITLQAMFEGVTATKSIMVSPKEEDRNVVVARWMLYSTSEGSTSYPEAVSVGDLTAASGLAPSFTHNGVSSTGWNFSEPSDEAFYEFSIVPTNAWPLKVGALFLNLRSTKYGPPYAEVRYALDAAWMPGELFSVPLDAIEHSYEMDFSDITVSPGQTLRVRLYAWGASSSNGTLRVNSPTLYGRFIGMLTNHFAIALSPATDFEVVQGQSASIKATAMEPGGAVSYSWDAAGVPGVANGNDFTIDTSETGGPYTVTCRANDGTVEAAPRTVSFSIAPLPPLPERYPVTVGDIEGGSLSVSHSEASEGTLVTVTAFPDVGKQLLCLTVNGAAIPGTSFPMPGEAVTVSAVFSELSGNIYTRVEAAEDFEDGADYLVVACSDGRFSSAMGNYEFGNGRIGLKELGADVGSAIANSSGVIVWTIQPGKEDGNYTLFNKTAGVFAAFDGSTASLTTNGTDAATLWTLDFSVLPAVKIASTRDSAYILQRNATAGNKYYSAYTGKHVMPCLFKKGGSGFSIGLTPASTFEVPQTAEANIVATAFDASGPVAYRWGPDGVPGVAKGNVFHIDTFAMGGPYTVTCDAYDGSIDCAQQQVTFSVVSAATNDPVKVDGWSGQTRPFRVDARAGNGEALEVKDGEWAAWDTAWTDGASRTEVTLEHPDGSLETLGAAEGKGGRGNVEWAPGADEWGTFTLRLASWDADGEPLEGMLALRIRRMPVERAYADWIEARGGTPEAMPMEADSDADGASNWEEYVADTDPLDAEETFASRLEVQEDGTLRVIPSVVSTGRLYRAKLLGDLLEDGEWLDLGPGRPGIGAPLGDETAPQGFGAMGVSLP